MAYRHRLKSAGYLSEKSSSVVDCKVMGSRPVTVEFMLDDGESSQMFVAFLYSLQKSGR